jgi:2-alkyl-3-oxoalkanoate reductase
MKIFVAGASGALGKRLIPLLVQSGYDVTAMSHRPEKAEALRAAGARPVVADGLDREAVIAAVRQSKPDVIIHQMTNLAGLKSLRNFDAEFASTNRLRTAGTDYLVEAAQASGARRIIVQSYGNWTYGRGGAGLKTERDPLDPHPPARQKMSLEAIRYLEQRVVGAADVEGVALRYGSFYGSGTSFATDGDIAGLVRRRMLPIIGDAAGVWSFIHLDDAAAATAAAIERGSPGLYNIVDDQPAPVREWLPQLAQMLGAKPPLRIPVWLGRLIAGDAVVSMMTQIGGVSNEKAARELGWRPRYKNWRDGFAADLAFAAAGLPNASGSSTRYADSH